MNTIGRMFIGRERVVREITQGVLAGQPASFSLVGSKLVGKSQLLAFLAHEEGPLLGDEYATLRPYPFTDDPLVLPVRADCHRSEAQEDLMEFLANAVAQQARGDALPLDWTAVEAQGSANRRLTLLVRQMNQLGYRLVILLDNFDKVFANLPPDVINQLRPLTLEMALVVATEQPLHDLDRNLAASPLFNVMTQLFVGLIEPESERRWLMEYSKPFPSITKMVDDLVQLTGGHPYLLRRMGDILQEVQQMLPSSQAIGREHLAIIRLRLAEHGRLLFETVWRRLQNPPPRIAASVVTALLQRLLNASLAAPSISRDEAAALNWLINQAVVACCGSDGNIGYQLFSPLFGEFLAGRMPDLEARSVNSTAPPIFRHAPNTSAPFFESLTKTEAALLYYFQTHSHQVIAPEQLLHDVWKRPNATARRVQEAIRRLRLELDQARPPIGVIENDRGRGYRFVPAAP